MQAYAGGNAAVLAPFENRTREECHSGTGPIPFQRFFQKGRYQPIRATSLNPSPAPE
jgi:hypothetical protein